MRSRRLGVKVPLQPLAQFEPRKLIPVFHSWIQNQVVDNHLLIDVHDYSHVCGGPGILLIGFEGDFCLDGADLKPGLFYQSKNRGAVPISEDLERSFRTCLNGCHLLEDSAIPGLQFDTSHLEVEIRDRLYAPNDEQSFAQLEGALKQFLPRLVLTGPFEIRRHPDREGPLRAQVKIDCALPVRDLRLRLN